MCRQGNWGKGNLAVLEHPADCKEMISLSIPYWPGNLQKNAKETSGKVILFYYFSQYAMQWCNICYWNVCILVERMNCSTIISATSEDVQAQREIPFICFGWEGKEGFWSIHCKTRKSILNKQVKIRTAGILYKW